VHKLRQAIVEQFGLKKQKEQVIAEHIGGVSAHPWLDW
jgi:hypothetical protein